LDFLWLSRAHDLVGPASLIARDEAHAAGITAALRRTNGDLLEAERAVQAEREAALARKIEARRALKGDEIDLFELARRWHAPDIIDYAPSFAWERRQATERQIEVLRRNGVDMALVRDRGHASILLSSLFAFKEREPATERQKNFCRYLGHPNPWTLSKREAGRWIEKHKAQHLLRAK
jgi:hypothetical protein